MRRCVSLVLVAWWATGLLGQAGADDDVQAIVTRAIKAHGGEEKIARRMRSRTKSKGTLELGELKTTFTNEVSMQLPDQLKSVLHLQIQGQDIPVTQVFDKGKGWIVANGMETELKDKLLDSMKEALFAGQIETLTPLLKEKGLKLTSLGETMVSDKPALGVKVSSEGHKDVELYFDKDSGLLVKRGRTSIDGQTMTDVFEEAYYSEFKDFDGIKVPQRVVIHHEGKKFMEIEVTDFEPVDKFPDNEFAKPAA